MDSARVDRTSDPVRFWQQLEQVGFERPQSFVEEINRSDLFVSQLTSDPDPVLSALEIEDSRDAVIQHEVSFADARLVPFWTQRNGLRLTACLEGPPGSAAAQIAGA